MSRYHYWLVVDGELVGDSNSYTDILNLSAGFTERGIECTILPLSQGVNVIDRLASPNAGKGFIVA